MEEMHRAKCEGREKLRASMPALGTPPCQSLQVFMNPETLHTPSFKIFNRHNWSKHWPWRLNSVSSPSPLSLKVEDRVASFNPLVTWLAPLGNQPSFPTPNLRGFPKVTSVSSKLFQELGTKRKYYTKDAPFTFITEEFTRFWKLWSGSGAEDQNI